MEMKTKLILLITLAGALGSFSAWAQLPEMELIIEPAIPNPNDVVKISVTNSACYERSEVESNPAINSISITLTYALEDYEQCLEEDPDAPDFETTIGPLAPGEYGIAVRTHTGGFIFPIADSESLLVTDAPVADVSDGGINGLYHRTDSPHQYFYVLETVYNTLVVWNTFDANGDQLWVYGVGDLQNEDQSVVAEAWINRSVGFTPGGEPEVEAEPWGVIRFYLTSCTEGKVTYTSDVPEAHSGEFDVVRLAYSKQIGCDDSQ